MIFVAGMIVGFFIGLLVFAGLCYGIITGIIR